MGDSVCPFCGIHPYEYVDIGVGQQPVAVTCCSLGYGLLVEGLSDLREAARLIESGNAEDVEKGKNIARKYDADVVDR